MEFKKKQQAEQKALKEAAAKASQKGPLGLFGSVLLFALVSLDVERFKKRSGYCEILLEKCPALVERTIIMGLFQSI